MEKPEPPTLAQSRVSLPTLSRRPSSLLLKHLADQNPEGGNRKNGSELDHDALKSLVLRIEVQRTQLLISLKPADQSGESATLSVLWQKPPSKRSRKILLPAGAIREEILPERAERRPRLVAAIVRGRKWLDDITTGAVRDSENLAKRERCTCASDQPDALARLSSTLTCEGSRTPATAELKTPRRRVVH